MDLTQALYHQERSAVIGHAVMVLVMTFFLTGKVPGWLVWGWPGVMLGLIGARAWVAWKFEHRGAVTAGERDRRAHTLIVFVVALGWTSGFLACLQFLGSTHQAIFLLVLAGLTNAALVTLSARLSSFILFAATLLVPSCVGLALTGGDGVFMAAMGGGSLLFSLSGAKKARTLTYQNLLQRYRNEEMVQDLARAKAETSKALQRSETANEMKREFLTNMSHEVRTPMNGILGMAELLLQSDLQEEELDLLRVIQRSGRDLLAILDDVLDLSKIEGDRLELVKEPFELTELLDDVADFHALTAAEKGLEFLHEIPFSLPPRTIGDAGRLRQVLNNLLSNAIKFTDRGCVSLKVEMGIAEGVPVVDFTVQDDGIGIPQESLAAVFHSFTQADGSHTRRFGGTGLGLTITKRLVELMNGRIMVDSQVGKGTAFRLRLPLDMEGRVGEQATGKVLLVTRLERTATTLARRLRTLGLEARPVRGLERCLHELDSPSSQDVPITLMVDSQLLEQDDAEGAWQAKVHDQGVRLILLAEAGAVSGPGSTPSLPRPFRSDALLRLLGQNQSNAAESGDSGPRVLSNLGGMRILVAEDNPTNARLAKRMLEQLGQVVEIARDGSEAVECYQAWNPDLIFMDVQMPILDGIEATRRIRCLPGGDQIPILALTAHAMKGYRERCLESGMDDYYTKPLRKRDLEEALHKWQGPAQERRRA